MIYLHSVPATHCEVNVHKRALVVVATTTSYPDAGDIRARLALQTFARLQVLGYPVFVVDGNSDRGWRNAAQDAGVRLMNEGPDPRTDVRSMGAGRRQVMAAAAQETSPDGAVVWMEPEKLSFADAIKQAAAPVLLGEADLVMPKRQSLASYPPEQQLAEHLGNMSVQNLLGYEFDFWFGPRVWSHQALPHMIDYAAPGSNDYGDRWDSIMIPCLRAMAADLRVVPVEVDYTHPEQQTFQERGDITFTVKRIAQLQNIVPALVQEVNRLGIRGKYA